MTTEMDGAGIFGVVTSRDNASSTGAAASKTSGKRKPPAPEDRDVKLWPSQTAAGQVARVENSGAARRIFFFLLALGDSPCSVLRSLILTALLTSSRSWTFRNGGRGFRMETIG